MSTTKPRIHLAVSDVMHTHLRRIARRQGVPLATAVVHLVAEALELEEDRVLQKIAETREQAKKRLVSHEKAWS